MRTSLCVVAAFAALPVATTSASPPAAELKLEKYQLRNRLTVVLNEDHRRPRVAVNLSFRSGAQVEGDGQSGFSRLAAGMTLGGCFADVVSASCVEEAPREQLEPLLERQSDRLASLQQPIAPAQLQAARVALEAQRDRSFVDAPYGATFLRMWQVMFPAGNRYHDGPLGESTQLAKALPIDVEEFMREHLAPGDATLVVVGDFEPSSIRDSIERLFAYVVPPPAARPRAIPAPEPIPLGSPIRQRIEERVARTPRVDLVWPAPPRIDPEQADAAVALAILTRGKGGRLRPLVKKHMAKEVEGVHSANELNSGWIRVTAIAERGRTAEELLPALERAVEDLRRSGPTQDEVNEAVHLLLEEHRQAWDKLGTVDGRAELLARAEMFLGDAALSAGELTRYQSVTPTSVQAFVQRTMRDDRRLELLSVPRKR